MTRLPVKSLHIGDTGAVTEEGYYTLGPLVCVSGRHSETPELRPPWDHGSG